MSRSTLGYYVRQVPMPFLEYTLKLRPGAEVLAFELGFATPFLLEPRQNYRFAIDFRAVLLRVGCLILMPFP